MIKIINLGLFYCFYFLQQTTRSPNVFEISPRPFSVTTSPLQARSQFGTFGANAGNARQNNFQYQQNINFPSQPQRQNPYLDNTGFAQVITSTGFFLFSFYFVSNFIALFNCVAQICTKIFNADDRNMH